MPPLDWGPEPDESVADQSQRKKKKIYIPRDNPEINFMGLLIGPRGSTQKRLEEASGARILIRGGWAQRAGVGYSLHYRVLESFYVVGHGSPAHTWSGRGSEREGEPPSTHPDDDDDLHVSIEGTDEAIEKATKEVSERGAGWGSSMCRGGTMLR
jgi:hypothetical protein